MCCGSRRSTWRAASAPASVSNARTGESRQLGPQSTPSRPLMAAGRTLVGQHHDVKVDYTGPSTFRVHGPVTGRAYVFSRTDPSQSVDVRDASVLLHNTSFRRSAA